MSRQDTAVTLDKFCTAVAQVLLLTKVLSSTDISRVVVNKRMAPSPTNSLSSVRRFFVNIRLQESETS
jgi:hypothetical protein